MSRSGGGRRPRRRFSDEFKEGAVRLVLDEDKTVGAVARELDLTESARRLWVEHARAERTRGKSGLMKEEREELTRRTGRSSRTRSSEIEYAAAQFRPSKRVVKR